MKNEYIYVVLNASASLMALQRNIKQIVEEYMEAS